MSDRPPHPPLEVLLVEDNPGDVRLVREALREGGSTVRLTAARDGEEALAMLRRQGAHAAAPRPALILLDLNLPRMGGRELLAVIKADPALRRIPVVVLTSSRQDQDVQASYDLHANCYITKPADLEQFLQVVRSIENFWLTVATLPGEADMASGPIRVLLVEDNPGDARLIHWMLREAGEGRFEFAEVGYLEAALERLRAETFCVVLLDLSLPDSQGLETFRTVYAAFPETPIVVLTGLADEDTAVRTVEEGAQDYLVKAQVHNGRLAHALRYAVGRRRRQRLLDEARGATPEDLKLARRVQEHLFPKQAPACVGVDLHGASFPAGTTGGDYFDYLPLNDGGVGVVIADVMGKGLGPALLMMATRAYVRAFAHAHADIDQVLALTNRALAADVTDNRFVTLLLAQFDAGRGVLRYSNAGHDAGYVLDPSGAVRTLLYSTGLPLGIKPDGDFPVPPEVGLAPGEMVVLWTDGVVNAHSPHGERFGADRALAVVRANLAASAEEVVAALCEEARRFTQGRPQEDDITAIVLKVRACGV